MPSLCHFFSSSQRCFFVKNVVTSQRDICKRRFAGARSRTCPHVALSAAARISHALSQRDEPSRRCCGLSAAMQRPARTLWHHPAAALHLRSARQAFPCRPSADSFQPEPLSRSRRLRHLRPSHRHRCRESSLLLALAPLLHHVPRRGRVHPQRCRPHDGLPEAVDAKGGGIQTARYGHHRRHPSRPPTLLPPSFQDLCQSRPALRL